MLRTLLGKISKMRSTVLKPFGKSIDKADYRISICDSNERLAKVSASVFAKMDGVEIVHGDIFNVWADALVSPANSFGDMSGGLDRAIYDFFGREVEQRVQAKIREQYLGEMPVGNAFILEMQHRQYPHLIVAPTMRVPGKVAGTLHAYLAMRGLLGTLLKENQAASIKVRHIVVPGLCTGVGGLNHEEAAIQMLAAYKNVMLGGWREIVHPAMMPFADRG